MSLYLVRHGQTQWNKEHRWLGKTDIGLNELGLKQAKEMGEKLKDEKFDAVFCSSLLRAKQTTAEICRYHAEIPVYYTDDLTERNLGSLESIVHYGRVEEIYDKNLEEVPDGVETLDDFSERVFKRLDYIKKNHKTDSVLVVAHGGVARMFKVYFEGMYGDGRLYEYDLPHGEAVMYEF